MIFIILLILSSCSNSKNREFITLKYRQIKSIASVSLSREEVKSLDEVDKDIIIEVENIRYITKQLDNTNIRMAILSEENNNITYSRIVGSDLSIESFDNKKYNFTIDESEISILDPISSGIKTFINSNVVIKGMNGQEIRFDSEGRIVYISILERTEEKKFNLGNFDEREDIKYEDRDILSKDKKYVTKIEYDQIDGAMLGIIEEYYEDDILLLRSITRIEKKIDLTIEKSI